MVINALRTVIIYVLLIIGLRIMGKRQLGELHPAELVVTLLIADLAAVPMQESGMPLLLGLMPIFLLVALEVLLSGLAIKIPGLSRALSGSPVVLIQNGILSTAALRKIRMTAEDLFEVLRKQNIFDMNDVHYAVAEVGGTVSVFLKKEKQPAQKEDVEKMRNEQ